jgi:hypothetical protein
MLTEPIARTCHRVRPGWPQTFRADILAVRDEHDPSRLHVGNQRQIFMTAPDKDGNTIDFLLRANRDKTAAQR